MHGVMRALIARWLALIGCLLAFCVWLGWMYLMAMANDDFDAPEALLTPSEVAALFRVNPKTVTRWARAGKLTAIRTLGGHRRFRVSEIRRCLEEMSREEG